jgi:intracellular multiplication protein IcmO
MYDLQVARQQHGYLSMQFTRAMQSLADEYGYIFKAQLADIDVLDLVLNRRILVVLIPALEKSEDEAANLGKIVASCLKGMMGATLGNTVEGGWESAIGSKQTRSNSSFMTVFDEVGYYTTQGMAVMAAQARSLGFALVFASQDLPAMEKRIKAAAKSIVGNCNLKILGRIEDPTETKTFVQQHGGQAYVSETKGYTAPTNTVGSMFSSMSFHDDRGASIQVRQRIDYDHLRGQREGEAHLIFGDWACKAQMFYAMPEKARALRVHRFLPVPGVNKSTEARDRAMLELSSRLKDKEWTALSAGGATKEVAEIAAMAKAIAASTKAKISPVEMGIMAVASMDKLPAASKAVSTEDSKPSAKNGSGKPAPLSDDVDPFDDVAIPAVAANKVATSYGVDDVSGANRASVRAQLPPLHQGDEFAIDELQRAPAQKASQDRESFTGTDADLSSIIPALGGGDEDVGDFSSTVLPDAITAVIAHSAQQMNEGLRGKTDRK